MLIATDRRTLLRASGAFTVAHSLSVALATLGYVEVPALPLNAALASTILFLGPEIVCVWRGETSFAIRRPWVVAFAFGLVHGFGFAGALGGAGSPSHELPLALLGFDVGVELGQLGFVALVLGVERLLALLVVRGPAWLPPSPGYVAGSLGAFWTIQRTAVLLGIVG